MDTTTKIINDGPLVSVLILTHNRAKYIRQAIDSVFSQTYTNIELIVINDGSTDDTHIILTLYTDARLRVITHEDNAGLHTRRKESLTYVQGTYVAILDSDDVWTDRKKIEKQVDYMEAHSECGVVGTFVNLIDDKGDVVGTTAYRTSDQAIRNTILARNQFTHSSVLMRRSALAEVQGYRDTGLAEDLDLFLQLGAVSAFANIPLYMTSYRIHPESFNHQRTAMAKAVLEIIKEHRHKYPRYYRALVKAYFRIFLHAVRHGK